MKRSVKGILAALTVLSMTACAADSADTAKPQETPVPRQDVDVSDLEGVPAEAGTDIVSYLTDGALNDDTVLLKTDDGTYLMADELSFELAYQKYDAYYYYSIYYGMQPEITEEMQDGTTLGEYIASFAADNVLKYTAAKILARENDLTMSEEYASELGNLRDNGVQYYGESLWSSAVSAGEINEADYTEEQKAEWVQEHGNREYRNYMLYFGTTEEGYNSLLEKNYWYLTAQEQLFAEGGKYELKDEALAEEAARYAEENGAVWARCILFSTMNDEDADAVKAAAQKAYEELSALSGEELSETFTDYQSQYDGSGYTAGEIQMYLASDSLVDGYYDGITVLKPGELGITDQTAYGYFILLREEDRPEDLETNVKENYAVEKLQELTADVLDRYGMNKDTLLEKIDVTGYYGKLEGLQELIDASRE